MVQFLPSSPSFGEKLVDALSQAGEKLYSGHQQRKIKKIDQSVLLSLQDESKSPMEKIALISQLSPQTASIAAPLYAPILKHQVNQRETQQLLSQLGFGGSFQQPGMTPSSIQQPSQMLPQYGQENRSSPDVQGQPPGLTDSEMRERKGLPIGSEAQANPGLAGKQSYDAADPKTWSDEELQRNIGLLGIKDPSAQFLGNIAQSESERRKNERKESAKEKSDLRKQEAESYKATEKYRESLLDSYKASKSTFSRLDRMQELNDSGKLAGPSAAKFMEALNIPVSILSNPESEEFSKLSQDLMSNITQYFGNRILQIEVQNFLKTIPTLMNSEEGRDRIIHNMKLLLKPQQLEYKAYQDIRKKGGPLPLDLHEQILERIEPQLDELSQEFKTGAPQKEGSEKKSFFFEQKPEEKKLDSQEETQSTEKKETQRSEKPTFTEEATRNVARTGARVLETAVGLPGDIVQGTGNLIKLGWEKATGKKFPSQEQIMKENPKVKETVDFIRKIIPQFSLKSSSEIREELRGKTGDYLEPRTKGEAFSDEIASDFVSLAIPIKGKIPFMRALGLSLGSNIAKEGVKAFGAGEGAQEATKLGSLFVMSSINPKGASKFVSSLYKEADELLPKTAKVSTKNLSEGLRNLEDNFQKGGSVPSKTKAIQKVKEIRDSISKGNIEVEELTSFKRNINELRSGLYEEFKTDKSGMRSARRNLNDVSHLIDSTLEEYGKTNPAWWKKYSDANEGFGAIAESKKVSNFIGRVTKQYPKHIAAGVAAEIFLAPHTLPAAITSGALGYAGLKGSELIYRLAKSPVLRKYYRKTVESALKEDAADTLKSLSKMDSLLKKDEKRKR